MSGVWSKTKSTFLFRIVFLKTYNKVSVFLIPAIFGLIIIQLVTVKNMLNLNQTLQTFPTANI